MKVASMLPHYDSKGRFVHYWVTVPGAAWRGSVAPMGPPERRRWLARAASQTATGKFFDCFGEAFRFAATPRHGV